MISGLTKVFSFTVRQRVLNKGWRLATLIVTLLCLLLPPVIMGLIETLGTKEDSAVIPVQSVYVADLTEEAEIDFKPFQLMSTAIGRPDYAKTVYHLCGDADDALQAASEDTDAIVMILEKNDTHYSTSLVLPDNSTLSDSAMDDYRDYLNQIFPYIILTKSNISMDALADMTQVHFESSSYTTDGVSDTLISGDSADASVNLDNVVKEVLGFVLPFLTIMLLYFLILFYGQGTANSVVLEKTSKLMDTFLLSVRPEAMVLGKVLAQAACCMIQVSLWILGLAGGFYSAIQLVTRINPDTEMPIIRMFQSLGILSGIFTPVNILFFILFLFAGLLLYLALSAIGGSIAGKQEDLNTTNILFTMILVVSFLFTLYGSNGLDGIANTSYLDWIPFTSILIAPSHVLLGVLSIPAAAGSLAIVFVTALVLMVLAGRIYKAMALYKGNLPNVKQLIGILFSKG